MWPLLAAGDDAKYFLTTLLVNPGKVANWPLRIALIHVCDLGLKAHWQRNWMSSLLEVIVYAEFVICVFVVGADIDREG